MVKVGSSFPCVVDRPKFCFFVPSKIFYPAFACYTLNPILLLTVVVIQVHVQSDPAGRLIISGQPKQLDNPWGVTPFKKVGIT